MSRWLVAFGAPDPESERARNLLDSLGIEWVQATVDGRPVDGRTAYACDPIAGVTHWFESCPTGAPPNSSMQARPCMVCGDWPLPGSDWAGTQDRDPDGTPVWGGLGTCGDAHQWGVVLDHHRPGDPGFGSPAEEFLAGSSIGQLLAGLSEKEIPNEILLVAAADHCLAAAYRGECPGIDPEDLMKWRAASRAAYQQRDVKDVLRDIQSAIAVLQAAPRITIGRPMECVHGYCAVHGTMPPMQPECDCGAVVVDLRGVHVPELPEAQARLGISVLCDGLPNREGRAKVNVMGDPRACAAFLRCLETLGCDASSGYGDPSRGIVGAYRAEERP